jgi:hypothetical protein
MTRVREVPWSNSSRRSAILSYFMVFFQVNAVHGHFLSHPSQFIIHHHPTISTLHNAAVDTVSLNTWISNYIIMDKAALGQAFLRILRFSPGNIIPPWAPHFRKLKKKTVHSLIHSHPGTNKRPVKTAAVQWDVSLAPIIRIPEPYNHEIIQEWNVLSLNCQ